MRYYRTKEWIKLRSHVLKRDGYRCAVPGCGTRASCVDHILSREAGGRDEPGNLRSLCHLHDRQVKELRRGSAERSRGGTFVGICDKDGMPLDPKHPWFRKKV